MTDRSAAPATDPGVAQAAYSSQRSWRAADRTAVRMSGPPKVGMGELSRMARKKRPAAPRWRRVDVKLRVGRRREACANRSSMLGLYQGWLGGERRELYKDQCR